MQVAYWQQLMICYMAFTNKGQTKAAATFKGNFGVYGLILFKICMYLGSLLATIDDLLHGLYKQRPQQPLKVTLVFT